MTTSAFVFATSAARNFYEAARAAPVFDRTEFPSTLAFGLPTMPQLWLHQGEPGAPVHIALHAEDRAAVDAFHTAALAAGGRDNGAPGVRHYHPDYYAAYVLDAVNRVL